MFDFCLRKLGMSGNEAYLRLTAASLVRRYPVLLTAIASRRVTLSNVVLLKNLFRGDNIEDLIDAIAGKTKRQVQLTVREATAPTATREHVPDTTEGANTSQPEDTTEEAASDAGCADIAQTKRTAKDVAFDAGCVELGQGKRSVRKVASDASVANAARSSQRTTRTAANVGRAARRAVFARDGEQCSFVSAESERCPAREMLELDHREPRAKGGDGSVDNVRVLCRAHNLYEAEQAFGRKYIAQRIEARRSTAPMGARPLASLG